LLIIVLQRW